VASQNASFVVLHAADPRPLPLAPHEIFLIVLFLAVGVVIVCVLLVRRGHTDQTNSVFSGIGEPITPDGHGSDDQHCVIVYPPSAVSDEADEIVITTQTGPIPWPMPIRATSTTVSGDGVIAPHRDADLELLDLPEVRKLVATHERVNSAMRAALDLLQSPVLVPRRPLLRTLPQPSFSNSIVSPEFTEPTRATGAPMSPVRNNFVVESDAAREFDQISQALQSDWEVEGQPQARVIQDAIGQYAGEATDHARVIQDAIEQYAGEATDGHGTVSEGRPITNEREMSLEAKKEEVYAKIAAYMSSRNLRALEVFRQFDRDRNNSISMAELRHAIETVTPPLIFLWQLVPLCDCPPFAHASAAFALSVRPVPCTFLR
jgi:hypothetical protein